MQSIDFKARKPNAITVLVAWIIAHIAMFLFHAFLILLLTVTGLMAQEVTDEERAEYAMFETTTHMPPSCFDAAEYVWDIRAFASEFEMNVNATGGALGWGSQAFIQHWELHDGPDIFRSDRLMVVGEEIETGRWCLLLSGVRGSF